MPRTRTIPDARVFLAVEALRHKGGTKAVSFATVSAATGLAAPTLAQRYGSIEGMLRAARSAAWDEIEARTVAAMAGTAEKGPQALLKAIGSVDIGAIAGDLGDPELAARAHGWRAALESALAQRLGASQRAKETASMLVAAWLGQTLWPGSDDGGFRLKDMVKRLS